MTDPCTPQTKEAQLPDPLNQKPEGGAPEEQLKPRGSEDAQLFAEAEAGEGDVEQPDARTND
jgi:hypothetical protein